MKKAFDKARKGFSLVELLIAVVVLGILGAMLIAAGTAAQNKARISVASNDIDSARNAIYTALMMNPSVAGYTDATATATNWDKAVVDLINAELDETWQWDPIGGTFTGKSGPVAQTRTMRDPWGNPYTLYLYNDTYTECFYNDAGAHFTAPDSTMTLVVASAGPNATGVGTGVDGTNGINGVAAVAANMVNNTDGIDDIGVIMQLANGSTTQATFGWSAATFGTLENINWVFCGTSKGAPVGKYSQVDEAKVTEVASYANGSSIKLHPTLDKIYVVAGGTTEHAEATKADPYVVDN